MRDARYVNIVRLTVLILFSTAVLSACTKGGGEENSFDAPMTKKKITLKVVGSQRDQFRTDFGFKFQAIYPNVSFTFVERKDVSLEELIESEHPDLVVSELDDYGDLANNGLLEPLDSVILKSHFDTSKLLPGVIDALKEKVGGTLFGLTPFYQSEAIYYNADLFKQFNIEPPAGVATLDSLFDLAGRFAEQKKGDAVIYGLAPSQTWTMLLQTLGRQEGLQLANAKAGKMTIDSDGWRSIILRIGEGIREGSMPKPEPVMNVGQQLMESPYSIGHAALTIGDDAYATIAGVMDMEDRKFDNRIVPLPRGSGPSAISPIRPRLIMSVAKGAANLRAAWEVVQYAAGEEWTKQKSLVQNGYLLARSQYQSDVTNKGVSAFYEGLENQRPQTERKLSDGFTLSFELKLVAALQAIADEWQTVEEAVAQLQVEGQALLDEMDSVK